MLPDLLRLRTQQTICSSNVLHYPHRDPETTEKGCAPRHLGVATGAVNGEHDSPDELADRLEREADELERHSDELAERVAGVRQDWERKRGDQGVPGAPPPEGPGEASAEGNNAPTGREADDAPAEESG